MPFPYDGTLDRDEDDELRREDADARRARRRATACQCGDDLPGFCPGPQNCPYSDFAQADEDLDDGFGAYPHRRMTVVLDRTGSRFRDPF